MGIFDFFSNGASKKNGVIKIYHDNGQLLSEGNFKDGKEDGVFKYWHENGQLRSECLMENGERKGELKLYDENGELKSKVKPPAIKSSVNKTYKNKSEKEGSTEKVKFYHDNGKLRTEATLDTNGKPHGNCKEWYPNGNIFKDQNFKHGVPNGSMLSYFENGNIKKEENFIDGQWNGFIKEFYEDGSRNIIESFKDGKSHGIKEQYYPSGNLEFRANYEDGLLEGVSVYLQDNGDIIEEKIMQHHINITNELMQLMLENNGEHLSKAGLDGDGYSGKSLGDIYLEVYQYYKKNNLRVENSMSEKSLLFDLDISLHSGKISQEQYNQILKLNGWKERVK